MVTLKYEEGVFAGLADIHTCLG